jgi:hypothetical protein
MYGGLMMPSLTKNGSNVFGNGSGYYHTSHDGGDHSSPFSEHSMVSPFYDPSPRNEAEATYFGYKPTSPKTAVDLGELENFSFKRLRSLGSQIAESTDSSPVSRSSKQTRFEPSQITVSRRPMPRPTVHHDDMKSFTPIQYDDDIPLLKLGDEGRAKLKSALSEQARTDPHIKDSIEAIGKIRLASVQQLMQMARVSGLWDYAQSLAQDHEVSKAYKRSS